MTTNEFMTLVLSFTSVIIAVVALFNAVLSNRIIIGQTEVLVRERISSAKIRIDDLALHKDEYNDEVFAKVFDSAVEELLNSYDGACQKYIDNKLDRKRFKKSYFTEVLRIFNDESYNEYIIKNVDSYKALMKVKNDWMPKE
jgi:hypothetical protein